VAAAHLVLFDLRPGLADEDRRRFHAALSKAVTTIPSVRRCRVGRRVSVGAGYERAGEGYAFVAVLEFDDEQGLRLYLEHPSHAELGALFWSSTSRSLVLDFELAGDDTSRLVTEWS
jgi:hypothetical protein